jgi:uncharacterized protein (UPF0179 family)
MADGKTKITLIGALIAVKGTEFVYQGPHAACDGCKVFKVCNNLQKGRRYRIVSVRTSTLHPCRLHEGGVYAVEVEEAPIVMLIAAEKGIVNSTLQLEYTCRNDGCKSYELCHPDGAIEGERYVVGEILGSAPEPCEKGRNLKLAELRPA